MKILTGAQIRELDKYTIEHEPIASIDLMERAARAITAAIQQQWPQGTPVVVFAGPGNNGGDVLTGIITGLLARGYSRKNACIVGMYLHGLAGDIAAQRVGKESLVASDIIAALPEAFKAMY